RPLRLAGLGIQADRVALAAERVEQAAVERRRRARPGEVPRGARVGKPPGKLAGLGIEAVDGVAAADVAHRVEALAEDGERRVADAEVGAPLQLRRGGERLGPPVALGRDAVRVGPAPARPVRRPGTKQTVYFVPGNKIDGLF